MRHVYKTLIILFITFLYSCNESYLDTTATDFYNEGNWWKTEEQVISSINGCYAILRNSQIYGISSFWDENISPNSYNMSGNVVLATGTHNAGNDNSFFNKWNAYYGAIGRVNSLLDNIDKVSMNDNIKKRIKGEAKFLRALFYYNLVNYYGGVPLILEAPDFEKHSTLPRNSRQEVIDQVLIDLDEAILSLPVSYSGSDIGRATKGAALAYKARVFLYENKWGEAARTAKEVIDMKYYTLFSNYRDLFLPENENNKEVIFDVQYIVPEFPINWDIIIELQLNVAPTPDLVNSYQMIDGKSINESPLYDPANPYENRDPRLHQTIVVPGYMYRGSIVKSTKYFSTGYGFKKYTTYKDNIAQKDIVNSGTNFIVLRYADVLLMYAEAQNESHGPDSSVYDALRQIRNRIGMPEIISGLSKDEMRKVIHLERRIELAGEGLYYHDIRRWRTAEVVMNANVLNSKGEILQIRTFNSQRDYLWPIHETTIQENPNLEQNPGF